MLVRHLLFLIDRGEVPFLKYICIGVHFDTLVLQMRHR